MLKVRTLVVAAMAAALAVTGTTGAAGADDAGDGPEDGRNSSTRKVQDIQEAQGSQWSRSVWESQWSRDGRVTLASGVFAPLGESTVPKAVTYDPELVPSGAAIAVAQVIDDQGMSIRLTVRGLRSDRIYGAHVHTGACGLRPEDSGPHYQNVRDPQTPSTDPRYANPENEVWLDFRTGADGVGAAASTHDWRFRPGEARSVVLHEHLTRHDAGHAGTAGARVACLTVPFHPTTSE